MCQCSLISASGFALLWPVSMVYVILIAGKRLSSLEITDPNVLHQFSDLIAQYGQLRREVEQHKRYEQERNESKC